MSASAYGETFAGRRPTHRPKPEPEDFLAGLDAPAWMSDGLCAQTDPEAFFPDKGGSTREAKAICRTCVVITECLAYAVDNMERYGIWGGTSEHQRRKLYDRDNPNRITRPRRTEGEPARGNERLEGLDLEAAQVRAWAYLTGHPAATPRGRIPGYLIDDYLAGQDIR